MGPHTHAHSVVTPLVAVVVDAHYVFVFVSSKLQSTHTRILVCVCRCLFLGCSAVVFFAYHSIAIVCGVVCWWWLFLLVYGCPSVCLCWCVCAPAAALFSHVWCCTCTQSSQPCGAHTSNSMRCVLKAQHTPVSQRLFVACLFGVLC